MNPEYQKIHTMIDFMRSVKEQSRQSVWHAIKLSNAAKQLQSGVLQAHTSHRYWPDGMRRQENDPLYEDSFWMYGWSMTRKKEYAFSWNPVVFEFDMDKIRQNFEVMPIAWNNLFSHRKTIQKKEFEEFVIAFRDTYSIEQLKKEDSLRDEKIDSLYDELHQLDKISSAYEAKKQLIEKLEKEPTWFARWQEPRGKALNLEKCLTGIYMNEYHLKTFLGDNNKEVNEQIQTILNHPKYKGVFQDPHSLKRQTIKP